MSDRTIERAQERAKRIRERTAFTERISAAQRAEDLRVRKSLTSEFHPRRSEYDPNKTSLYWID